MHYQKIFLNLESGVHFTCTKLKTHKVLCSNVIKAHLQCKLHTWPFLRNWIELSAFSCVFDRREYTLNKRLFRPYLTSIGLEEFSFLFGRSLVSIINSLEIDIALSNNSVRFETFINTAVLCVTVTQFFCSWIFLRVVQT